MKIKFHCPICAERHALGPATEVELTPMDSGLYDIRCKRGHTTMCVLQQMRFEVLFEIGVNAVSDGYFREAITSFASALERFLEFYILMVFKEQGKDKDLREKTWKFVSNRSERQLGAYLFLYTLHEESDPIYLTNKQSELRNDVVHNGKLLLREDAIKFGNAVLNIINPIVRRLKTRSPELLLQAVQEHQRAATMSTKQPVFAANSINTTICLAYALSVPDCEDISNLPQIRSKV